MFRPIVGISMGDPFGNGPEITVKALHHPEIYERCRPLVVGDLAALKYAAQTVRRACGILTDFHVIQDVSQAQFVFGKIDVLDLGLISNSAYPKPGKEDVTDAVPGTPARDDSNPELVTDTAASLRPLGIGSTPEGGEAAFRYVVKVIELAMAGQVDATVTNAISKEAIHMAGHNFSGHTEIYAHYTGTRHYAMMLAHDNLRVIHVSTHVSLREACDRVKKERVLECIRLADRTCKAMGIASPKIGVAGLNPHCGEGGQFGREEIEEIQPAIDEAVAEGIRVPEGRPTPPDTIFSKALGGWYDCVVAMYHDQGHIPLKVKGFVYDQEKQMWDAVSGVNITLGLPIIRVSVDHGTGFDQAGNGLCSDLSLVNSIDYAIRFAQGRMRGNGSC